MKKRFSILLFVTLFLFCGACIDTVAQIKQSVTNFKSDTTQVNKLNAIAKEFRNNNPDSTLFIANQALQLSYKINYINGKAEALLWKGAALCNQGHFEEALKCLNLVLKTTTSKKITALAYNNIGIVYTGQANYPEALNNFFLSLQIKKSINDEKSFAASYNNIGLVYSYQGNYPEALKIHFTSLALNEKLNDKKGIAYSYNNIGMIYANQGNMIEALQYHFKSLQLRKSLNDIPGVAGSYNNIGLIYAEQGKYDEALENYFECLKISESIEDFRGVAAARLNIGNVYLNKNNYVEALSNDRIALDRYNTVGDKQGVAAAHITIGYAYLEANKPREAKKHFKEGLTFSLEIGSLKDTRDGYGYMSIVDSMLGDYQAALQNYKIYISYRDSLSNQENIKKSIQTQMQYEFDKKEGVAKAEQDRKDATSKEEKQKQSIILIFVFVGLLLVIVFSGFLYNRFKITQKQKLIIEKQKNEVDKAYDQLREKNKEVMDSILYARRIQRALLTPEKTIAKDLKRLNS